MTQPQTESDTNFTDEVSPNSESPQNTNQNRFRHFLARQHLPNSLILAVVLLVVTNIFVTLINQPTIYWLDSSNAVATAPAIKKVLEIDPFIFAGIATFYVLLIWLLLSFLPRYPALVLWMILSFLHLRDVIQWSKCGLNGIYYDVSNRTACGAVNFTMTIIGAGLLGMILANAWFRAKPRNIIEGESALKPKSKRLGKAGIASIVWILLLTAFLIRATIIPSNGWQPVTVENAPKPRVDGRIVYDANRGKAVLFGGATGWVGDDEWISENDTWEWDGTTWEQMFPQVNPPDRLSHAMAYDENRGVTVLFGGKNRQGPLNDLWEWNGENWEQYFPQVSPPARCCHQMYYDSDTGKIRVYGGYDGNIYYDDMWEWDGVEWHQILFDTPSPVASGFQLAYDSDRHQLVTLLNGFPTGTWTLADNRWSDPQFETEPISRSSSGMGYDTKLGRTILFGGAKDNQILNDTWSLDEEWQEMDSPLKPSARWGHGLYYDSDRERIVIFGGFDGNSYLNDMWELVVEE